MKECHRQQALHMAKHTGITLAEEQVEEYDRLRNLMPTDKKGEETHWACGKSDQELLYRSLGEEEQKAAFKRKYPRIIFDGENLATI